MAVTNPSTAASCLADRCANNGMLASRSVPARFLMPPPDLDLPRPATYPAPDGAARRPVARRSSALVQRAAVGGSAADGAAQHRRAVTRAERPGLACRHVVAGVGAAAPAEGADRDADGAGDALHLLVAQRHRG